MLCVNLLGESTKSWNRIGDRLCTLAYARVNKKKSDCDWSQCPIGIDPNRTLGLIPMSNWDWSQSDIGTDPNGTMGLIPMSNWSQSLIGIDQNLAVVTQRIMAGAWLLPMEHRCCDPLGNGGREYHCSDPNLLRQEHGSSDPACDRKKCEFPLKSLSS